MDSVQQEEPNSHYTTLYTNILETAKLAGTAAAISLAGTLIGVFISLSNTTATPSEVVKEGFDDQTMQHLVKGSTYISTFISLIISLLAFFFLFRFSTIAKAAIKEGNNNKLGLALQNLAGYFKIWGILMFLIVVLFGLSLLGGILGGAIAGK